MASPTPEEILEIFEDLNYPSAAELRAALIKQGYKARLRDVEAFVKSQTPGQLFAKAPQYRGKIIASRPNERWVVDFIDYTDEPSGKFEYIRLVQDNFSPKLWATAEEEKVTSAPIERLQDLIADHGKTAELNADGEFDNKTFNIFVSQQGIAVRFKEVQQDLATLDATMHNFERC